MEKENHELKNIIEAALLMAGEPLTFKQLSEMFDEAGRPTREELECALEALANEYETRGIELKKIDRGWRLQTKEKYATWLQKLNPEKQPRYSRALLETLAIIAYRQPITRGEIEDIRGVSVSTEIIRTLLEREWIQQVGHKDVPGKPALYGTTKDFLGYFNLRNLKDLPELPPMRELTEIDAEIAAQENLPVSPKENEKEAQPSAQDEQDKEETATVALDAE